MKELKLIPPTDPRVQTAIAPFTDDMLKEHDFKDRKELTEAMFTCMNKFHGIGLTCNQVGLPFNMFVAGGHPSIEGDKASARTDVQAMHYMADDPETTLILWATYFTDLKREATGWKIARHELVRRGTRIQKG